MSMTVTLPASPDHELSLDLGRMKRVILNHREGLVGKPVHIESDRRDFHVEDVVMPFLVADLREAKGRVRAPMSTSPLIQRPTTMAGQQDMESKSPIRNMYLPRKEKTFF